jgi:hypothetical protein
VGYALPSGELGLSLRYPYSVSGSRTISVTIVAGAFGMSSRRPVLSGSALVTAVTSAIGFGNLTLPAREGML